jgi:aspartate beta-hydroxylase
MLPNDLRALMISGFEALGRNDPRAARHHFERVISENTSSTEAWYGLSCALRQLGESKSEAAALDRGLAIDARDLSLLIAKGDWHLREQGPSTANVWYAAAIDVADAVTSLPASLQAHVERVRHHLRQASSDYQRHLTKRLEANGLGAPGTARVAHALDLLLGKRKVYLQQPTQFFFPEFPQVQFYDRTAFPWAALLEAETRNIRFELQAVLTNKTGIVPYKGPDGARTGTALSDPRWSVFYLVQDGREIRENSSQCPMTMAALQNVPLFRVPDSAPTIMFSLLQPGVRILPHHGLTNTRLICHLPLIVPPNCGSLRVGNEARHWQEGTLLAFDDTIEHEAWNSSSELRAVLIFDIWRPELTQIERDLVSTMFSAVGEFGSKAPQGAGRKS